MWTAYISRLIHGPSHNDDLLNTKESLRVSGRRKRQISQRTDSHERDSVGVILAQNTQDLFVRGALRSDV